jgi:hypothetical protein
MKKILILTLTVLVLASGVSFAETLDPDDTKASVGAVIDATGAATVDNFFKFSKGVYCGAEYDAFSYALTTAHLNGSKFFGTGFDATAIFVKDAGQVVKDTLEAPSSSVAEVAFAGEGWSKM